MAKKEVIENVSVGESAVANAPGFPDSVPVVMSKENVPVFQVFTVGKEGRVYGKTGSPVSPVVSVEEANTLASKFNTKDPEQIEARARKPKKFTNPLAEEANS